MAAAASSAAKAAARRLPSFGVANNSSSSNILMREALQGIRPLEPVALAQMRELINSNYLERALVSAVTASSVLHASFPAADGIALLDALTKKPADLAAASAVRQVINTVLYSSPGSDKLTSEQVDVLIAAAARFHMSDAALAIAGHALKQGKPLSALSAAAIIDAVGHKIGHMPPVEVLEAYRGLVQLLHSGRVQLDARIAKAFIRFLTGPHAVAVRSARSAVDAFANATDESSVVDDAESEPVSRGDASTPRNNRSLNSRKQQLEAVLRTQANAADPLLDEAFSLIDRLPDEEVASGGVLPALLFAALRCGKRARALQVLASMQARGLPVPTACFNALIESDASLPPSSSASKPQATSLVERYLQLMRDCGAQPDGGTLTALTKTFLYRPVPATSAAAGASSSSSSSSSSTVGDGSGVATYLVDTAAALRVPLHQRALGTAAFYAAKHGNVAEVTALVRLLKEVPHRADAPPPRWLRKLGSFLLEAVDEPAAAAAAARRRAAGSMRRGGRADTGDLRLR